MIMERSRETRRPAMAASKKQKRIMRDRSIKQRRYQDQESTEESLGFSEHQAPPPLTAAREMIGVTVPRKARSAAGKRSHESFSSGNYGGVGEEEQSLQQLSFKAASLSFSNVSSRKKMKPNGPKIRIPKSSNSPGPVEEEEDIEIEIAEVLYGLMKQTQNSKTSKFETKDRNDSEEKKVEAESASMAVQSSSAAEAVEVEDSDQPEKIEACSEAGSGSMDSHEEKANPYVEEKSSIATKAKFSCEDSIGTKAISTGWERKRKRDEERFEFDLMAPPPMEQDDDVTESASDPPPPTEDVDMKIEVLVKTEVKQETFVEEVVLEKSQEKKINENPNQDRSSKSTTTLQPSDSLVPQPQRKRCATHRHIAHNICLHQKVAKTNDFWPAATGSVPQCGTKPDIPLLGSFSGPNLQHSQEKEQAASKLLGLSEKDRSSEASSFVETSNKMQLSVQPAYAGNQMHGHAFAFPRVEDQATVAPTSNQSVPLKFAQSTNNAALSSHSAARPLESSSVNFNGYQYPISTHIGTTAMFGGGNPAQALPVFNAPFYSNQMFHPAYVQQHQVQPSHQNANVSSASHRQHESHKLRETQFSSSNCFTSQKQHVSPSLQHCKLEGETNVENAASPAAFHAQNSVHGQNFSVPFQHVNFTLMPYVTMGGGGNGNRVEQSQQQGLKGGVELIPSKAYGMSFSSITGNNSSGTCLNFSSMAQNPAIFQSLPDMAQQGYKITPAPQAAPQKNHHHQISQRKTDGGSNNADDGLRAASGKSSSNIGQRQTLVFDNSSRTLNFMSSNSQQQNLFQFQMQNPHLLQKQQPAIAAKVPKSAPVSSQALMQCNSHHQSPQLKNSTVMSFPLQQGRGSQGRTQISFGGNPKSAIAPQGKQRLTNNHSSSISALQSQQTENSSLSGNGPISSPACGRNLPSILSTCPSHISELKY